MGHKGISRLRKIISLVTAVAVISGSFSFGFTAEVMAETEKAEFSEESHVSEDDDLILKDGPEPATSGDLGGGITWEYESWETDTYAGESLDFGTLYIKGSGATKDYTEETRPFKDFKYYVYRVVIDDRITSIGDYMFYGINKGLDTVFYIPESVTKIGDNSLLQHYYTHNYTTICYSGTKEKWNTVDEGEITPPDREWDNPTICYGKSGDIADSSVHWETKYEHGEGILKISGTGDIPDMEPYANSQGGITYPSPFMNRGISAGITKLEIESGITGVGSCVFSELHLLREADLGDSVKKLGESAFYNCYVLKSVTFSTALESIAMGSFVNCKKLEKADLPEGLKRIEASAFAGCTSIKEVTIPSSLEETGGSVFSGSKALEKVNFNPGLKKIPNRIFEGCKNLKDLNLVIPDTVTEIGEYAFSESDIENITIPESVEEIGASAFEKCSVLGTVNIPDKVRTVSDSSFTGCTSLTKVSGMKNAEVIGKSVFSGCSELTEIEGMGKIETIGEGAFYGCSKLNNLNSLVIKKDLPDSVFEGCTSLSSITFGSGAKAIGAKAFYGCSNLTDIDGLETVKTVGEYAFSGCTKLRKPDKLTIDGDVGDSAFEGLSCITSVKFGNLAKNIGKSAFSGTSITALDLPENIETIGESAFSGCEALKTADLFGSSVKEIKSEAFFGCINLKTLVLPLSVNTLGEFALVGCFSLESITIPETLDNSISYIFDLANLKNIYYSGTKKRLEELCHGEIPDIAKVSFVGTYTVKFRNVPEDGVIQREIKGGLLLERPDDPVYPGDDYIFDRWVLYKGDKDPDSFEFDTSIQDKNNGFRYEELDFTEPVVDDLYIFALWVKNDREKREKKFFEDLEGKEFTISFNSMGGTEVPSQTVSNGEAVKIPDSPSRNGYIFAGWFNNEDLSQVYNFVSKFRDKDETAYAKWLKIGDTVLYQGSGSRGAWKLYDSGLLLVEGHDSFVYSWYDERLKRDDYIPEAPWKRHRDLIKAVVISGNTLNHKNGLTDERMGWTPFSDLVNMTDLVSESVTSIAYNKLFSGCMNLENIWMPNLNSEGDAFKGCISIPEEQVMYLSKQNGFKDCIIRHSYNIGSGPDVRALYYPKTDDGKMVNEYAFDHVDYNGCINLLDVFYGGPKEDLEKVMEHIEFNKEFENYRENLKRLTFHCNCPDFPFVSVSFDCLDGTVKERKEVLWSVPGYLPVYTRDSEDSPQHVAGWFKDSELTMPFDENKDRISDNRILYAKWADSKSIDVTFYGIGGEVYKKDTVHQGRKILAPEDPVKEGYIFDGWFVSPQKEGAYINSKETKFDFSKRIMNDAPVSIFAHWREESLKGYFEVDGYAGSDRDEDGEKGETDSVNLNAGTEGANTKVAENSFSIRFNYTDEVTYDGRKHVYKDGKTKESKSKAPDIRIENLEVRIGGVLQDGFSIKSVRCIKNKDAFISGIDPDIPMKLYITLNYPSGIDSNMKKSISKALSPKYNKKDDLYEPNDPAHVLIKPVILVSENMLFTASEVKSDSELKQKNGILVWKGQTKSKWKLDKAEGEWECLSVQLKGLKYQTVFEINGKKKVKQIPLKGGRDSEKENEYLTPKNAVYRMDSKYIDKSTYAEPTFYNNFTGTLGVIPRSASDIAKDPKQ